MRQQFAAEEQVAECDSPREAEWMTGLDYASAEELLDRLENYGCTAVEMDLRDDGFAVRCVCPPGLRLGRDGAGSLVLLPT
jgi:hypothetical protein